MKLLGLLPLTALAGVLAGGQDQHAALSVPAVVNYSPAKSSPEPDSAALLQNPPQIWRIDSGTSSSATNRSSPSLAKAPPSPGVYEARPFTCIVVVPSSDLDKSFLVAPPDTNATIRTVVPEIELVPIKTK